MDITFTNRGFAKAEFIDRSGERCSIQKSSIATEDCIWLGSDKGERMHLTVDQVKDLLPLLELFVSTGEIYEQHENDDH